MSETEEQKKKYTPSEAVEKARQASEAHAAARPGAYQSLWQAQLDDAMQRILNREPFTYNLNGDALYQQYKNQAVREGRMAMLDTMGQAASMTGGYGNSYAQSVGQQTYQKYLQGLNDRIPELYALALEQYDRQGQAAQQQYDLLMGREKMDYSRYQDDLTAWQRDESRLWDQYSDERDFDYGTYRDTVKDEQWQADFDESLRRFELEWAAKHPAAAPSPGGGGGGSSGGSGGSAGLSLGKSNYNSVLQNSIGLMQNGASYQNIQTYLSSQVKSGAISSSDVSTINRKVTDARDGR